MNNRLIWDLLERSGWTGVQASLALLIVDVAEIDVWWAAPVGLALAAAKSWVGGHVGRRGTGSTLPESKDPATPPAVSGAAGPGEGGSLAP